eukprot:scaffold946_cov359-Pavlova_lutheri.AAC.4
MTPSYLEGFPEDNQPIIHRFSISDELGHEYFNTLPCSWPSIQQGKAFTICLNVLETEFTTADAVTNKMMDNGHVLCSRYRESVLCEVYSALVVTVDGNALRSKSDVI